MLKKAFFCFCSLFISVAGSFAVADAADDVELYVEPEKCVIYGSVRIYGFVKPSGTGADFARLDFSNPDGDVFMKRVQTDANGEFEFAFSETDEPGQWKVTAYKDGAHKSAEAGFWVSMTALLSPLIPELEKLDNKQTRASRKFKEDLTGYPDFPGKDKMLAEIDELLVKSDEFKQSAAKLKQAVKALETTLISVQKPIPVAVQRELASVFQEAYLMEQEIKSSMMDIDALMEQSQSATEWCFMWQSYSMIFDRFGILLNFVDTKITSVIKSLAKAGVMAGLPYEVATSITACEQIISGASFLGFFKYAAGTFTGLGQKVSQLLVEKYCVEFKGRVQGEYFAQLLHQEMPFLQMSYVLEADASLIFQKRQDGAPVSLQGRIRGYAKDFKCSMTMMPFDLGATVSPSWCRAPVPVLSSRSFFIYLKGQAFSDRLDIAIDDIKTGYDFDLATKGYYVMLSMHQPVPIPGDVRFPFMNGNWFFTRITHLSNPQVKSISLPLTKEGDKSIASKPFTREMVFPETSRRKGVKLEMDMEFKVCQPACK